MSEPMMEIPLARAQELRREIEVLTRALWIAAGDAAPYAAGAAVAEYIQMAEEDIDRV